MTRLDDSQLHVGTSLFIERCKKPNYIYYHKHIHIGNNMCIVLYTYNVGTMIQFIRIKLCVNVLLYILYSLPT